MPRLGLFGSAAPRVARRLAAEPQIEQRDMPDIMPPPWLMERARAQGFDPMLALKSMQEEPANARPVAPANNPMPSSVPPMGMFGGARKKAMSAAQGAMAAASGKPSPIQQPPMSPEFFDLGAGSNGSLLDLRNAAARTPGSGIEMPTPQPDQPLVKGGLQTLAADQGAFMRGPRPPVEPVKSEDDGGFWRTFGYRPDETGQEFGEWFFSDRKGVDQARERRAEAVAAEKEKAELARQVETLRASGMSEPQIVAFMNNPEKWSESLASNLEASNLGQGETRYRGDGGANYVAPNFGFEGATPFAQTFADGKLTTSYGDNRPKSYAEATDEATLAETGRSNRADEALGRDRLGLDRSKFQFERDNPGAANGGLTPYQQIQVDRQLAGDKAKTDAATATARTSITNIQEGQTRVQALLDHPGFKGIYGNVGLGNAKPTFAMDQDELNAVALLDQIGGEAFLAGVEKMRGTGPLSDNEGKRVMQAVTRLTNRLQDPASATAAAQEFMASLQRLEEAVAQESSLQDMVPRLAQAQAAERERTARQSHSGAILGGTGQFNPAAFQGLAPSAADMADDELRAMLGLD